jgi:hypothetical protein
MPRTGVAHLPLHGGFAPRCLFDRMVLLSREFTLVMVEEFGPGKMLVRLSDPHWFQAFGCLLDFDWHSSGLTTVVCGALKQALRRAVNRARIGRTEKLHDLRRLAAATSF